MLTTPEENITTIARREIAEERLRELVDAEKLRIRTRRSPWSRFLAWLPFTITWKKQ